MPELKAIDTHVGFVAGTTPMIGTGPVASVANNKTPDLVDAANLGWQLQLLNGVAQGTTLYTRIGQKIVMMTLVLKLTLSTIANGAVAQVNNPGQVRIMVIYDAQANATALTGATLSTALLKDNTSICSPQSLDNRERFKVLLDKYVQVGMFDFSATGLYGSTAAVPSTTDKACHYRGKYKAGLKLDEVFNGTSGGTIGDIQTGALYLLVGNSISNSIAANTAVLGIAGYSRVRFYDA